MKGKWVALLLVCTMGLSGCAKETADKTAEAADEAQVGESITESATDAESVTEAESATESLDETESESADKTDSSVPFGQALENLSGGSPWKNSCVKELVDDNMKTSEKDDFYLATNYGWIRESTIPQAELRYSDGYEIENEMEKKILALLEDESIQSHEAKLVRDLYNACMDWDARNALGMEPFQQVVDEIRQIKTLEEMNDLICDPKKGLGLYRMINCKAFVNPLNASEFVPYIYMDDLSLVDKAEYDGFSEMGARIYMADKEYLSTILGRLGIDSKEAVKMLDDTLEVEEELMSYGPFDDEEIFFTMEEMSQWTKEFPLERLLAAEGLGDAKEFLLYEPDSLEYLGDYYKEENLEKMKSYMIVRYMLSMSGYGDRETVEAVRKRWKAIYGAQGDITDEDDALSLLHGYLEQPLAHAYNEKYDSEKEKERITELIDKITKEYRTMLEEEDWLQESTRKNAIDKLDHMTVRVLYPDKWSDYSKLDLSGLSLWECWERISEFYRERNLSKIGTKVDKDEWSNNSILVENAYYTRSNNSITILQGMAEGNHCYDGISDEELYAGLGGTIAHEISHAFDPNGAMYDKDGNWADWWTREDKIAYNDRVSKALNYFNNMMIWKDTKVNGNLILGEAVADQTAMKVLLRIAAKDPDFDYEKFFSSYAKRERIIMSYETEQRVYSTDSHPVPYIRINSVLQQFDEFYETYDIKEGDGMYLAPEDRINVW